MSFSYDAGSTTPNLAGLLEFNGLRINDGTFVLTRLGGLLDSSPPVRPGVSSLPSDHGGQAGLPFYDPLDITVEGYLTVPTLADIWGAMDLLRSTFNFATTGLQELVFNTGGFANKRQVLARVAGPIVFTEPLMLEKMLPDREFVIPLVAPDPMAYNADSAHAVTVTTATALPQAGTANTPFVVRWTGPLTDPVLTSPSTAVTSYTGTIASGHWVEVNTNPAAPGGVTAVDDLGANVYANVTALNARFIRPGSTAWTATAGSGAGTTLVTYRDAWA